MTGVTFLQANSTAFRYAYASAIAGLLTVPVSSVVISGFKGENSNRTLMCYAEMATLFFTFITLRFLSLSFSFPDTTPSTYLGRHLTTSSVQAYYSVSVTGAQTLSNFVQTSLTSANAQYQIINTVSASNQGFYLTAVNDATVATSSPTAAPSLAPSAIPTVAPTIAPTVSVKASCFAGSESVTMKNGETKLISDVQVGDIVLAADASGNTVFSPVVFVPHGANANTAKFIQISTADGRDVKMTLNHVIPAGFCGSVLPLVYASAVTVGECITTVTGQEVVSSVAVVEGKGVYTIVTKEEFIVVNGIIASPFGANHMMANLYYNMHRLAFSLVPSLLASALLRAVNEGMGIAIPLFGPVSV